jgi:hypothetical protein
MGHDVADLYLPSMCRRYSDTLMLVFTLAHSVCKEWIKLKEKSNPLGYN